MTQPFISVSVRDVLPRSITRIRSFITVPPRAGKPLPAKLPPSNMFSRARGVCIGPSFGATKDHSNVFAELSALFLVAKPRILNILCAEPTYRTALTRLAISS
jgi:hypothetical protein